MVISLARPTENLPESPMVISLVRPMVISLAKPSVI